MITYTRYFCQIITLALLFSCSKSPAVPDESGDGGQVRISLSGNIKNESGQPAQHVLVEVGDNTTETDANGDFSFNDVSVNKTNVYVEAFAPGYFNSGRNISTDKSGAYIEIQLAKKEKKASFQAATGVNVVVEDGASLKLPANAYVIRSSNQLYTGEVQAYIVYINKSQQQSIPVRPGNNVVSDEAGRQKGLRSYGMFAVELEGANGEKLDMKGGKAILSMPAVQGAPDRIALWYFDETVHAWKEEGSVARQGDKYTGEVSHFSWWSADVPEDMINLKITFLNAEDQPFAIHKVRLSEWNNDSSYVYLNTDSTGSIETVVPKGKMLRLYMYNGCSNAIMHQQLGPFNTDQDLGIVRVDAAVKSYATIRGTLTNCAGSALAGGKVTAFQSASAYSAIADKDGHYILRVPICWNENVDAVIIGEDLLAGTQNSAPITMELAPGGDYTIATLQACGTSTEEFMHYNVGGRSISFFPTPTGKWHSFMAIRVPFLDTDSLMKLEVYDGARSQGSTLIFHAPSSPRADHPLFSWSLFITRDSVLEVKAAGKFVKITEYGRPGQFIVGTFATEAYYRELAGTTNVTCNFRMRRWE